MDLSLVQKNWDKFGSIDPFWSILTVEGKQNNQWDIDEFFKTGEVVISGIINNLASMNIEYPRNTALDFGCGAGRLTQGMAQYFDRCYGIDIAPSMIELANKHNKYKYKCKYVLNTTDDLKIFNDNYFGFICSLIVLQHIKPKYIIEYIKEFIRILLPKGILIFQLPSEPQQSLPTSFNDMSIPLCDDAFNALISVENNISMLHHGLQYKIPVKIKNNSNFTWPSIVGKYQIQIGNHWLDQENKMIIRDDGRCALPHDLQAGETIILHLIVNTPSQQDKYFLEFDMVQENHSWFKDKGSMTAKYLINVSQDNLCSDFIPKMEMNCIPKQDVLSLVSDFGAQVVTSKFDSHAPGWNSYIYYVTK